MLNGIAWAEPGRPDGAPEHNRVVKDRLCALVTRAHGLGDLLASRILDQSVEQELRSYDGLLQSYADEQDVMPMRFGTCVATLDDVQDLLGRHEVTSTNWLRSFAGRREFAVRVQRETDPSLQVEPHADGGRNYLARQLASRKAVEQSREQTQQFLFRAQMTLERHGVLQKLAKVPSAEHRIAGWACLISRVRIEALCQAVETLNSDAQALGLSVTVSGPHAPFAFAALEIGCKDPIQ